MIRSLFLAANPSDTDRLNLGVEFREISAKIRSSDYRDTVELIPALEARPDDLVELLNIHRPDIVHFSGHGSKSGEIVLVDSREKAKIVSSQVIKALFSTMKDNIRLVLLNNCHSESQISTLLENIDCVIGMNNSVTDRSAIVFSSSFYQALGYGKSVMQAFKQSKVQLLLEGISGQITPVIKARKGVDLTMMYLDNLENSLIQGFVDGPPFSGNDISETIQIWGWAYAGNHSIAKIEVWINGSFCGYATYGTSRQDAGGDYGYYWNWNTREYPNGKNYVEVKVFAENGRQDSLPHSTNRHVIMTFNICN